MPINYSIINLIDILKTKTFVIEQYINSKSDIYYDGQSYTFVEHEEINYNLYNKIITKYKNIIVNYYIYTNIRSTYNLEGENNYPLPMLVIDSTNVQQKKYINAFNKDQLSIHYPSQLKKNNTRITLHNDVDNYLFEDIKSPIDSSDLSYKIFYHPELMNNLGYISYTHSNDNILIDLDIRKCIKLGSDVQKLF
ncbi:hypothetical protein [Alphaentomopoxvirus acuprea]|uniref:Uncharacterized protein n=1 Tax=Alphaentomopoxvirus acuprea TaxID=62099 RepID=W6JIV6_9POXV|nr:hypothetical protein BA82_gp127 [Anomala cuprea entomopoxvirus]BAO49487.1 hypothetical protein [Anomala cuprea entomopoxvirus]